MRKRIAIATLSCGALLAGGGGAALAKGGDDVRATGSCTGSSSAKIKAKPRDGRIEVEFEVDQNRNGVRWKVRLKDNGVRVFKGSATTRAPSGSFSIERRIANRRGTDRIKGIGKNRVTGERCVAKVSV